MRNVALVLLVGLIATVTAYPQIEKPSTPTTAASAQPSQAVQAILNSLAVQANTGLLYSELYVAARDAQTPVIIFTEDVALVEASKKNAPKARDVAGERKESVIVEFDPLVEIRRTPTRVEWSSVAHVRGLAPSTSIKRSGSLTIADVSTTFAYTVANKRGFTWALDPPSQTALLPANRELLFNVTTAEDIGTNLRICNVSLSGDDNTTLQLPPSAIDLSVKDSKNLTIPQGEPTRVELKIDQEKIPYGTYKGSVSIALTPSTEIKQFNLTISNSSWIIKLVGVVLLLAGITISLIAVNARLTIARAEAMLPFSHLFWLVQVAEKELASCVAAGGPNAPPAVMMARALADLGGMLSESTLNAQNLLPKLWPSTAALTSPAAYLQDVSDRLTRLKLVILRGLCPVFRRRATAPSADITQIDHVLAALDGIAAALPTTVDAVQHTIDAAILKLPSALPMSERMQPGAPKLPATAQLFYRANAAGSRLWVIWAAVTAATGFVATILVIPGFGTPIDLVKCFLWGFGVNIIGAQLQQLTPGSIASIVGISLPSSS